MANPFKVNRLFLDSETVAEQLRSTRQAYGYKLEKASKDLGISLKYLAALERGDFASLPRGVYGKNFLREYALYLKLDPAPLVKLYEAEQAGQRAEVQAELFSKQVVRPSHLWITPRIAKNVLVAALVATCLLYLGYRLGRIAAPPELAVLSPADNLITRERSVEVRGRAESETQVAINAEPILLDQQGNFSKVVELKAGINTIVITAEKKFGRKQTIKRQVLAEE